MKRMINSIVAGLALVIALAVVPASAQESSRTVVIKRDTKLGSEVLPKGEYAVKFVDGQSGEVVFLRGKREVLKATFVAAKIDQSPSGNMVVYVADSDGSYQLKRIEFKGKSTALVFDNTVATSLAK
jgi:Mg-chelatase subunit ChlD